MPAEGNAIINNFDECMTSKMEEATLELGNLIAALNLGLDVEDKLVEKLRPLEYINMEGEDDFEVEYSTKELVQLVQDGEHVLDSMEVDPLIFDSVSPNSCSHGFIITTNLRLRFRLTNLYGVSNIQNGKKSEV